MSIARNLKAIVVLSGLMSICCAGAIDSRAAEQLANPFGGYPPGYSPDFPEDGRIRSENWAGKFLGYERDISIIVSVKGSTFSVVHLLVHSQKGDEYCLVESGGKGTRFSNTEIYIPPQIGGCWLELDNDQYRDIGGVRYGSISCAVDAAKRKGQCVYRSVSTGKTHPFSVRATEYRYWD